MPASLMELLPTGIFRADVRGAYVYVNRRWCEAAGIQPNSALGTGWTTAVHPDDLSETLQAWTTSVANGQAFEKQYRFRHWDGTIRRVLCRAVPEENEDHGIAGYVGTVTDITGQERLQTQAEEELRQSEERLALALASTNDGLLDWNMQTGATYVNPQYYTMLGYEPGAYLAATDAFRELCHPDDMQVMQAAVEDYFENRSDRHEVEIRLKSRQGDWRWILSRGRVVSRDEAGRPLRMLGTHMDTTERKRAEEELRKRERELEEAQSIGHIGSWTWDVPKDKLVWSDEVYRILGYEPQQFPAVPLPGFLEFVHPDDREKVERAAWAAFEARTGHDIEHRIVRPDGTVRFVRTRSLIQTDSSGQPLRLSATIHDVTEERQAAAREAARLRRLKQLSELSMMLAGDPATVFERVVRMIGELFEVRVVRLAEIVGHDLSYRAVYVGGKVISNAGSRPLENTPCAAVEECRDIRIYERVAELFPQAAFLRDYSAHVFCGFPSLDNEGNVVAVTSLVDDKPREFTEEDREILRVIGQRIATEFELGKSLAEHARMEEELRENERRLEEAQHMAHLGSYTGDLTVGRMEWSDEVYRIYEIDPALGAPDVAVVLARAHPDDRDRMRKNSEDLVQQAGRPDGNRRLEVEHRLLMPDGRIKYVLVQATVSFGADGRPRIRGTVQDITERKHAEQERDKLQAQLAQAQKMESIGRLAGGVAHDFNNMLTVMLGYAAMSKATLTPDTRLWKYLTEIEKAGNRSKEITQKLLGFSRQQIIAPVPSNLNDVVADLQEPLARLIGEDIELAFHPSADLWKVVVDHSQVNQILLNLVVNARDAMPQGGKLTIETGNVNVSEEYCRHQPGATPGPHVLLAVSDTGMGMNEETLSHIFEPFFTTKDRDKGTGLGLATVYGIVKQNGGFVNVYSEPEHGTTFKIYFPQMAGEAGAVEIGADAQAKPAGHGTILLVEDDELVREMTKDALESIGYTPLVAESPQQAIELCSQPGSDIRLMLSDVVMPGMNGMELRERVLAFNPAIRVLFMSGYTSNVIVKHGVLKKGVQFIQKPFTMEDLGRRLEEVLASDEPAGH